MAVAVVTALIAVVCALFLPFASVSVNDPTVTWPQDPLRPQSTLLTLTAYRPLGFDVQFSCDVARLAQGTGGVIVSTTVPGSQLPLGLAATATDGKVEVRAQGDVLLDEPVPVGPCAYRITGESRGRPVLLATPTDPNDPAGPDPAAFAQRGDAEIVITRDGSELRRAPSKQLPDVDALATSVTAVPAAGGLSVSLRIDDEFTSSPTPLKTAVTALLVVALAATAALLWWTDRGVPRRRRQFGWPRVVDVAVPALIVFWMFVAPATDDDGYYAAMSRNSVLSGEVGNYYQLYDQNFTPFTWYYQALGWWQQFAGNAPVAQRIPAVILGVVTWFVLRRFAATAISEWSAGRRWASTGANVVLAVVFLSWWLPQGMGVRPETMVALCGAATLIAVLVAARTGRLAVAWLAFALAGLGFAAHPTGFTMFAPLLAGLPLLWPLVHVTNARAVTAARGIAVLSGGMVAPLLAFCDGAVRDFLRGQTLFLSIQGQESWTTEIQRYQWLLSGIPMGNFAKRAAVLACIVAVIWFAVLVVAARARRVAVPVPLWLAGSTTALSFAALWITPSKWTHHFGALAGVGSVFLALMLITGVPLLGRVLGGTRVPVGVLAAVTGSAVVAIALAWHGPNKWPYAWLTGMRRPELPPAVSNVNLDSLPLWVLATALIALMLMIMGRILGRRSSPLDLLKAVPIVLVVSLAATSVYLVGTFGAAAAAGVPREAVWGQGLSDPLAERCGAAGVVTVLDPATAQTLPAAPGLPAPPAPDGFVPGGGYFGGNAPQGAAIEQLWGSLVVGEDPNPERSDGTMTTGWYQLPAGTTNGGAEVAIQASGTLGNGNSLTAVYGRRAGGAVVDVDRQQIADSAQSPAWRTRVLTPPEAAEVVRLEAVDASGAAHGWLGFTAPSLHQPVVLNQLVPAGDPVALGWQMAFAYPCQRQVRVVDGISEPPTFGVAWGDQALSGLGDATWQPFRGGVYGQVPRTQSVLQLATIGPVDPNIQVFQFSSPYPSDAYSLSTERRTVSGASRGVG